MYARELTPREMAMYAGDSMRTAGISIRQAADALDAAPALSELGRALLKELSPMQRAAPAVGEWPLLGPPLEWALWYLSAWYNRHARWPDSDQI